MHSFCPVWLFKLLSSLFWSFAIPNVNADYAIPAGRSISWYPAGLDVVGGIRTSFRRTTTIRRLHPDGSVDDSGTINAAIAAARPNTLLTIPAGTYLIRNDIIMKSGVVLRGAQACLPPWLPAANGNATTLLMLNGTKIFFNGGSRENSWTPRAAVGPFNYFWLRPGISQPHPFRRRRSVHRRLYLRLSK